jgi:hypothetical protein
MQAELDIPDTCLSLFDYSTALPCSQQILGTTKMYLFPHNYHRLEEMGPQFYRQT